MQCFLPKARVRSVGEVHAAERGGLEPREGDKRRGGLVAEKETILELEHTNRVSMPSEEAEAGGVDAERREGRVGRVNERLTWFEAGGACSRAFQEA